MCMCMHPIKDLISFRTEFHLKGMCKAARECEGVFAKERDREFEVAIKTSVSVLSDHAALH